jgi:hypothetical protein
MGMDGGRTVVSFMTPMWPYLFGPAKPFQIEAVPVVELDAFLSRKRCWKASPPFREGE